MDAETLRDSILSVCGRLDSRMGGEAIPAPAPFQNLTATGVASKAALYETDRRSVYLPVLRGSVFDQFQAFDFPDPAVANGDRMGTTVASQALFMMNGPLMRSAPRGPGKPPPGRAAISDRDRMQEASMRILGRPCSDQEISGWTSFLERYQAANSVEGRGKRRPPEEGLAGSVQGNAIVE